MKVSIFFTPSSPKNDSRRPHDIVPDASGPDELERRFVNREDEVPVPVLTLLTEVDHVQQVGARPTQLSLDSSSEVRNRYGLDRRLRQKQVADRRMRRLREALQLPERGLHFATLPCLDLREAPRQILPRSTGPLTGPPQEIGLYRDADHG